jgi:hypothetical protein
VAPRPVGLGYAGPLPAEAVTAATAAPQNIGTARRRARRVTVTRALGGSLRYYDGHRPSREGHGLRLATWPASLVRTRLILTPACGQCRASEPERAPKTEGALRSVSLIQVAAVPAPVPAIPGPY